jgi:Ca-activated chloride channel family protein
MNRWFYSRQGQLAGPFTLQQLQDLARAGKLLGEDLVWQEGQPQWLPARTVAALFPANPPPPPPVKVPDKPPAVPIAQPAPVAQPAPISARPLPVPQPQQQVRREAVVPASAVPPLAAGTAPAEEPESESGGFVKTLLGMPKPVLFGLCGAVGGLLGALVLGELLWWLLSPSTVQHQPQVRMAVPSEMSVYLGGKNYFRVKVERQDFDGAIDLEAKSKPKGVSVLAATIEKGEKEAKIVVKADESEATPGEHSVVLVGRSSDRKDVKEAEGTIKLFVASPPAGLQLAVSKKLELYQGGKGKFTVKIARRQFSGSVKVSFDKIPLGIDLPKEIEIPANQTDYTVNASAWNDVDPTKPGKPHTIDVAAVADVRGKPLKAPKTTFNLDIKPLPAPKVDVVFVVDLTGSMQFAINGVKNGINNFVKKLKDERLDYRIGLVAFRDIEADNEMPYALKFTNPKTGAEETFTTDIEAFQAKVAPLVANGGGDIPESSLQGLYLAAKQKFRQGASKVLLFITDAVPKLHNKLNDDRFYPHTVEKTIEELKKNGIKQLHMVVRDEDIKAVPTPQYGNWQGFLDQFKGEFVDIKNVSGDGPFAGMLPKLGEAIAKETIAEGPKLVGGSKAPDAPPPSPVEDLPPATAVPTLQSVQSTGAYAEEDQFRLLLAVIIWTMVIAAATSLLILSGQHLYARQKWVGLGDGSKAVVGGMLAGLVGGAAGQLFFQAIQGTAALEVLSRFVGWSLLGGLIGLGMAFFVPNLRWDRGLLGGLLGGFIGAGAFLLISLVVGPLLGRWIGAAILGFCIGLMVALAEMVFRRFWLEISFSPREVRTVTLGAAAVSLGGDERLASIFVKGAPPVALSYWVDGEAVLCQDATTGQTSEVQPGERRAIGKVSVAVCSPASARLSGYALQLSNGKSLRLGEGMPLMSQDVPGLESGSGDGIVALVSRRPSDPSVLMLRNRSRQPWAVREANGAQRMVEPGGGLELAYQVQINFGAVYGQLLPDEEEAQ